MTSLAEIKAAAEAARRRYDKPDLQFARATEVLLLLDAQDWLLERVEELAEALHMIEDRAYGEMWRIAHAALARLEEK